MKKIKIGIKIGPDINRQYIELISPHVDFLEVYALPDSEYEILEGFSKPIVIHVCHFDSGVNFANPSKRTENIIALRHSIELADKFRSTKIIFHPELKENEDCSKEVLVQFIKANHDPRLLIENMPFSSDGFEHFCRSFDEIKSLTRDLEIGFCLDFAHAVEYLDKTGKSIAELESFINLKPKHFHITDTDQSKIFEGAYDERHLNFFEGNVDLEFCKSLLPGGSWITIETPTNINKQLKEIEYLRR